jgi:hypothetical protein
MIKTITLALATFLTTACSSIEVTPSYESFRSQKVIDTQGKTEQKNIIKSAYSATK